MGGGIGICIGRMEIIFNGNFRIQKWRYVSTIFLAIFWGDIPLHRPYIGLIYGRYLHFRILKFPLKYRDMYRLCIDHICMMFTEKSLEYGDTMG